MHSRSTGLTKCNSKFDLALCATVYPGVEPFLADWYQSVLAQTDPNFELWIASDNLSIDVAMRAMGKDVKAHWVMAQPNDSPAQIRQRILAHVIETCTSVILVDSDDMLHDSRVAAARKAIEAADLAGCALRLVNEEGRDLGLTLSLPRETEASDVLPRHNVFGLSNSVYRSQLLRHCLPVPAGVDLVDWFLATKAWLMGAVLSFDPVVRMDYRQHGANMAPIRFPFEAKQVIRDTRKVLGHYSQLLASPIENALSDRLTMTQETALDVQLFFEQVVSRPKRLEEYIFNLNTLEPQVVWWWGVAQPALQWMWKD
jgi:hypothetical protein